MVRLKCICHYLVLDSVSHCHVPWEFSSDLYTGISIVLEHPFYWCNSVLHTIRKYTMKTISITFLHSRSPPSQKKRSATSLQASITFHSSSVGFSQSLIFSHHAMKESNFDLYCSSFSRFDS